MKTKAPTAGAAANRILIVDDDAAVREMLTRVLVGEGYQLWSAPDSATALKIVALQKIDLVLLDLNLGGESGWDTFEKMSEKDPLLTVIVITARSNQLFTALGAGVGALLEKPLDFPKLLATVSQLLAEPIESRRARVAGNPAGFQHWPGQPRE